MVLLQVTPSWFRGIDALDRKLFFIVNRDLSNSLFDNTLPFVRESTIWAPLYIFMLVFAVVNFGKKGWLWFLFGICTAALGDLISSRLIKETVIRLRPCRNPEIADQVRILVNYCPGSSSFTSSHATNHFALSMFIVATMQKYTSPWLKLFFVWAAVISYAQVYVGVHYPLDVFCGALLGCFLGYIMSRLFNNYVGLSSLQYKSA
jgi:membrane-associated phospholipid phosphatase